MVSFSTAILNCFKKYAKFKGRAMRSEYWWWQLFAGQIAALASSIDFFFLVISYFNNHRPESLLYFTPFSGVVGLILFLPSLAVFVRRLHDINRSGWWVLAWVAMYFGFGAIGGAFIGLGLVALGRVTISVSFTAIFIHQMIWMVTEGDAASNNYSSRYSSRDCLDDFRPLF